MPTNGSRTGRLRICTGPLKKEKANYVYCHDSFRSTQAYIQLKYLGNKVVRVYNGGWGYWVNALELPVVMGDEPPKPYTRVYQL